MKSSPTAFPFRASESPLLDDRFLTFRRTVREIAKSSRALWSALVPSTSCRYAALQCVKQKYAIGASSALPLWYSSSCEHRLCNRHVGIYRFARGDAGVRLTLTLALAVGDRIELLLELGLCLERWRIGTTSLPIFSRKPVASDFLNSQCRMKPSSAVLALHWRSDLLVWRPFRPLASRWNNSCSYSL